MAGVFIDLESRDLDDILEFRVHIPLERRITFLRGDSGIGKTYLVSLITDAINQPDSPLTKEKHSDGYGLSILGSQNMAEEFKAIVKSIVVVDDNERSETKGFEDALKDYLVKNDNYLLIINRAGIGSYHDEDEKKKGKVGSTGLDYAVRSILRMKKEVDGVTRSVVPYIEDLPDCSETAGLFMGEDTYGITEFVKKFNINSALSIDPLSGKGRDRLINRLEKIDYSKHKAIFFFADLASFGKYYNRLFLAGRLAELFGCIIVVGQNYESFEYFVLCSNSLKSDLVIDDVANSRLSWEKYFEDMLEANGKLVPQYIHGKPLVRCISSECEVCSDKDSCSSPVKSMSDKKVSHLFNNTEFEWFAKVLGY